MKYLLASLVAVGLIGGPALAKYLSPPNSQNHGALEGESKGDTRAIQKENNGEGGEQREVGVTDRMILNDYKKAVQESGI